MTSNDARLTQCVAVAWAKSDPMGHPPTHWLPLWQHLDDTGDVAGYLWDEWLAPAVKSLISRNLPDGETDARKLVTWLAGIHDVGKVSPAFAIQAGALCDRMTRTGYDHIGSLVSHERASLRHERAGAIALHHWLAEHHGYVASPARKAQTHQFVVVVGGHHGDIPATADLNIGGGGSLLGDGQWAAVRRYLLDRAAARYHVTDRLPHWKGHVILEPAQMAIMGLVIMADWIASSAEYFPLLPVDEVPDVPEATVNHEHRLRTGIQRLNMTAPWHPVAPPADVTALFKDRFPGVPGELRPVQRETAVQAAQMTQPGLMIIEAGMGEGKTEAAFLAAETLAAQHGATGVFVALPTQATSNAMFTRMSAWLKRLPAASHGAVSVALVHGKAALNDDYQEIRFPQRAIIYPDDHLAPPESAEHRLVSVVDEWMTGRKRAGLSSFVVGTIDQVLFAALNARHVMLRQLSLIGKVVILDEVHAADVYMSQFLHRALRWLGAYGVPVVLLSATLPPHRRAELYQAYVAGRDGVKEHEVDASMVGQLFDGYPSVVVTSPTGPQVVTLPPSSRHVEVALKWLPTSDDGDFPALTDVLTEALRDGGCAVVVRNTVRRVQETAAHLAQVFGDDVVTVAHAQFLASDRIRNDQQLLDRFGPPGAAHRPERHIVVASQVVEQSLDVDFDVMVTDIAPADLVLQRVGRLHRHARASRPGPVQQPVCWVAGVQWPDADAAPTVDSGARAVYGHKHLLASCAVLRPYAAGLPLRLPSDIAPLVAAAYQDGGIPAGWEEAWAQASQADYEAAELRKGVADQHLVMEPCSTSGTVLGGGRGSVGVANEDSVTGQGMVRDGGDSLEVVVVQHRGGVDRIPDWVDERPGTMLPFRHVPLDFDDARALARCTLRLPFALTHEGVIDKVIADVEVHEFEGWAKTPFVSNCLALVLDDDRSAVLPRAGYRLVYDLHRGLIATTI